MFLGKIQIKICVICQINVIVILKKKNSTSFSFLGQIVIELRAFKYLNIFLKTEIYGLLIKKLRKHAKIYLLFSKPLLAYIYIYIKNNDLKTKNLNE